MLYRRWLKHEYLDRPEFKSANIVLLPPSMSFMLAQANDPTTLKSTLPNLDRVSHVFMPVTDNEHPELAEGGSHWSLLLVSVPDRTAFHYDSLSSHNVQFAHRATHKLAVLLAVDLDFKDLTDSPQQENGSDCGVFVCWFMKHLLLRRLLKHLKSDRISMSMGGLTVRSSDARKEMLATIEEFRRVGEKRRS